MSTACFACALQKCTRRPYMHFLLTFQKVMPISKTRNQLQARWASAPHVGSGRMLF